MALSTDKPKNKSPFHVFQLLFVALAVFLAVFELVSTGYFTARLNWANAVPSGALSVFWIGVLWLVHTQRVREVESDALDHEVEVLGKTASMLKDLAGKLRPGADRDIDDLVAVMLEVSPDGPPETDEQLRQIEKGYRARTGRNANLSFRRDEDGEVLGMDSEFSDEPASEAAGATTAVKVPVSANPGPKPPTKSQQRRINDQKGRGPFTDAELKEQANAKRRAARAAKAAEPADVQPTLKEKIEAK